MAETAKTGRTTAEQRFPWAIVESICRHRQQSDFFDATVIVDETEFLCHRLLLASTSDFFNSLFSSGMREDLERKVVLQGISAATFSSILDMLYFGKNKLTKNNILDIWHAANQLQISFLLLECRHYLKETYVCDETCFDVYQNAKVLDCQEMVDFTWEYFLKNFKFICRSEGILLLNHEELKALIENPDLVVQNEDSVAETIMRWVTHMPVDSSMEKRNKDQLDSKEVKSTVSTCPVNEVPDSGDEAEASDRTDNNEDKNRNAGEVFDNCNPNKKNCTGALNASGTRMLNTDEMNLLESEGRNMGISHSYGEKGDNTTVRKSEATRAEHLVSLLKACRVCLLSGTYITKALSFKIVLEDPAATAILNEAVQYHIRPDRRHDWYPPSGTHRKCSKLTAVVIGIVYKYEYIRPHGDIFLCCRKNEDDASWYRLGKLGFRLGYNNEAIAVNFGNNVYILNANGDKFLKYDTGCGEFESLSSVPTARRDFKLVAHGDFVYAVGGNKSGSVERFNVVEEEACPGEGKWEEVGVLTVTDFSTLCATVVGNQIIVLGTVSDEPSIIAVQSFNVEMRTSSMLQYLSGPPCNLVTFRKHEEAFILQSNGVLWRVSPQGCHEEEGKNSLDIGLKIRQEAVLWDFDREIVGAVLHNETLLLFGAPPWDEQNEWFLSVPGVFNRILNIPSVAGCYIPAVVPKKSLGEKWCT